MKAVPNKRSKSKKSTSYSTPRVHQTFHVGLPNCDPNEDYWLQALGKKYELVEHSDKTRKAAREKHPGLLKVADEDISHYTKEMVNLPQDRVVRVHVRKSMKKECGGKMSAAILAAIHVARSEAYYTKRASDGVSGPPPPPHTDYVSTAKAVIFHHADIMTSNADQKDIVYDYMDQHLNESIYLLVQNAATTMKTMGEPSTGDTGWAQLVQTEYEYNGSYHLMTQPRDKTQTALGPAMTQMMIHTKNDPRLQTPSGQAQSGTYNVQSGTSVQSEPDSPAPLTMTRVGSIDLADDNWNATLKNTNTAHGLESSIKVTGNGKLEITMKNYYVRWLGAYIRFYDADNAVLPNGTPMSVPNWQPDDGGIVADIVSALDCDYDDLRFIGWIQPINTAFAIPITADPGELTVNVTFPDGAVKAEIFGCGLGTGSNLFPKANIIGGVFTGLSNLGIPAFMLGLGVAAQVYKPLYDIMGNPKFIKAIVAIGAVYFGAEFTNGAVHKKMDWHSFSTLAQILFNQAATKALVWVEGELAEGEIEDEIPFAGWIMLAINIATGIAQIAETIVEVATSPWEIQNSISTSITSTITLKPDPRHSAFPQAPAGSTATFETKVIYKDNTPTRTISQVVPATTPTSLQAQFTNTLGGEVKFEVDYYIDSWLAGKATTSFMANNEDNTESIKLYLVEYPKPITSDTIFEHTAILSYKDNAYQWLQSADAPTATLASANNSDTGNAISQWKGLTLSQRYGTLGFAWKAAGMGLKACSNGAGDIQLYAFQNIDIPGATMDDVKFPGCGFLQEAQLIYDNFPPKFKMVDGNWVINPKTGKPEPADDDNPLGNYWVDPRKANNSQDEDGGYHLRSVDVTKAGNFNTSTDQLSHGRFPYFPDSFALHPSGHMIAINQQYGKIMVLQIDEAGAADDALPLARTYAGKALDIQDSNGREGLLFNPIAVGVSYDGTILILDQVTSNETTISRIQAFDMNGNPVSRFHDSNGGPSPFLVIPNDVNYLDLSVVGDEKQTYMFVLYYDGDGKSVDQYHISVYAYGKEAPTSNPVMTNDNIPAAKLTVDMWHTMYTLNYAMVQDGSGQVSGPKGDGTGPGGRTVPSVSEWIPSIPSDTEKEELKLTRKGNEHF